MKGDINKLVRILKYDKSPSPDEALVHYVLILEDKRFRYHLGFDPIATARATFNRMIGRPRGGASTIDMQLVRTITGRREKTARRKIREILLSVYIRFRFGRTKILKCYMGVAYTGYRTEGFESASRRIFGGPVNQCSNKEHSILAALLLCPAPQFRSLDWCSRIFRRAKYARRFSKDNM